MSATEAGGAVAAAIAMIFHCAPDYAYSLSRARVL